MNCLLSYMIRSSLYLLLFYMVYWAILSRDTAYRRNRVYLILSVALAFILPLISLPGMGQMSVGIFTRLLPGVDISGNAEINRESGSSLMTSLPDILNKIYITGIILSLLKFFIDLGNLIFLITRKGADQARIIRYHSFRTAGFSAMGYIFLNDSLSESESEEITKHELNHLRKHHFLDIVLIEIAKAFQWFNPAIYLVNRSLRAVHEYQADNECISSGSTITGYQDLLLRQIFITRQVNLSNSFSNPSLTRKRMIMMTKRRSSTLSNLKVLLAVPVVCISFILMSAFSTKNQSFSPDDNNRNLQPTQATGESKEEIPYISVEQMPIFPGGDAALLKYIAENTRYPEEALKKNTQGKVILRFCVTSKGGVEQISVIKSADPLLDQEAVRVTSTLPKFTPGRQGGKNVPVWYMIPVTFTLQ
jgi:TonB family protein